MAGTGGRSKKTAHALEQDRPDILKPRRAWFDSQPDLDPAKLAFIDETGLSTKMARLRGRAPAVSAVGPVCRTVTGKPRPSRAHSG
ncbi:hypothetical protein NN6n1_33800 [Shinella zoogloeoides]